MTEERRLFWFHFRFRYVSRNMGEVEWHERACYEGFDFSDGNHELINMSRIAKARETADVPRNAELLSVSCLGRGTRSEMLA